LEGGAYAVLDNMEALAEKGLRIGEVTLAGGGANSGTWRRIMADVIGAPLRLASTVETATLGAAILAGCGAGLYRDPRTASKELSSSSEVEKPRMEEHERYSARFRLFKKVYECLLPCYTLARTLERGA
jgi:sugar (pentulose or hexulose) kinase